MAKAEKQYKYTAKFTQPQKVGAVKLNPNGGILSERDYKTVKKDVYGASLLESGLLEVKEAEAGSIPVPASSVQGETVPDFDEGEGN